MSIILDASALLALIKNEPGADEVAAVISVASMSAANFSEVISKLVQLGVPADEALASVSAFGLGIVPVDETVAALAGTLVSATRVYGLSLGDRDCIATAIVQKAPAMTADRAWGDIEYPGLDIVLIR